MKLSDSTKSKIITAISYLYILLFVYASISKLLDFENFQIQLAQSPLLSTYAGSVSIIVILIELTLAVLLSYKKTRFIGLFGSFSIMVCFTIYIYLILNYSEFVPCSCGGVLEKLGWTDHLIFNLGFVMLAVLAIYYRSQKNENLKFSIAGLIIVGVLSALIVILLFFSSEYTIKKENNFTRRFAHHPIEEDRKYNLEADSYYFAGVQGSDIYLGNSTAPIILTKIDTSLSKHVFWHVSVDNLTHKFRSFKVKVKDSIVYMFDGSVPIIYSGPIGQRTATTISYRDAFFSQLEIITDSQFAISTQNAKTQDINLGILNLRNNEKVNLLSGLLEKQSDGVFDVDGKLLSDEATKDILYIYFYRNNFLVMDQNLRLKQKMKTIDTISRAQISTRRYENGKNTMDAPALQVNKNAVAHGGILFNQSNLMGKFESSELWSEAIIIDMYRTDEQMYLGSFYIFHRGKNKSRQMLATDTHLFILSGNEIVRYRFAQSVTKHFRKGDAENPIKE